MALTRYVLSCKFVQGARSDYICYCILSLVQHLQGIGIHVTDASALLAWAQRRALGEALAPAPGAIPIAEYGDPVPPKFFPELVFLELNPDYQEPPEVPDDGRERVYTFSWWSLFATRALARDVRAVIKAMRVARWQVESATEWRECPAVSRVEVGSALEIGERLAEEAMASGIADKVAGASAVLKHLREWGERWSRGEVTCRVRWYPGCNWSTEEVSHELEHFAMLHTRYSSYQTFIGANI